MDSMADLNCKGCEKRTTCRELANVAYPIFKEGLWSVSFPSLPSARGNENLLENRGQMEEFLKYMSVLLESKLYTDEAKEHLEQQLQVVHDAEKGWSFVGDSPKMKEAIRIGKGRKIEFDRFSARRKRYGEGDYGEDDSCPE